jgi:hypothetical protein
MHWNSPLHFPSPVSSIPRKLYRHSAPAHPIAPAIQPALFAGSLPIPDILGYTKAAGRPYCCAIIYILNLTLFCQYAEVGDFVFSSASRSPQWIFLCPSPVNRARVLRKWPFRTQVGYRPIILRSFPPSERWVEQLWPDHNWCRG